MNGMEEDNFDELQQRIETYMGDDVLELSYLVKSHIHAFVVGVGVLRNVERGTEDFRFTARRLCDLSRKINFTLPSPDGIPGDLASCLSRLFSYASGLIPSDDPEVESYKRNMTIRVADIPGVS